MSDKRIDFDEYYKTVMDTVIKHRDKYIITDTYHVIDELKNDLHTELVKKYKELISQ